MIPSAALVAKQGGSWLEKWEPESQAFWDSSGKKIARRALILTTIALLFSFATWFVISAVVVRLPKMGFTFDTMQLFWLAAMPGLAGGTLRLIHSFLIPIFGTRMVVSIATFIKIIPMVWLASAVMNPATPYWHFLVIAFLCGFGGGDFSSFMPSTSLFFPKKLQGLSLGIQAGLGNFGVSLTQFITPWIIGFAALGTVAGAPQTFMKTPDAVPTNIWMQNAALWYVPCLIVVGILCAIYLRSVPVKASFKQQLDILPNKHTWFCTITYIMTFGSFSGLAAAFPLMIAKIYGGFPNAPDPLKYAFLGPLVGSLIRVIMGAPSDKFGGSIITQISGLGLILGSATLVFGGLLTPTSMAQFPTFLGVMLFMFLMSGMGNASTFRQYPIVFAFSPRQGAGVIGWTAAWAAYGPFIFSSLIGASIASTGNAKAFFIGAAVFYVIASFINWKYYTKPGAERGDWGTKWGTWWDKAKDTWPQKAS